MQATVGEQVEAQGKIELVTEKKTGKEALPPDLGQQTRRITWCFCINAALLAPVPSSVDNKSR